MRYRFVLPGLLTLGVLGLVACGDNTTTEPTQIPQPGPSAPELAVTSNSWLKRADMWSVERTDFTTATIGTRQGKSVVYAIGGRSLAGGPLSKVMAYDVATNTWSLKAPLPVPLWGMNQAAVLGGKIYVSGGCWKRVCNYDAPSSALYVYNPTTNTWTSKADIPFIVDSTPGDPGLEYRYLISGGHGATGVIGGKLYTRTSCVYGDAPFFWDCAPSLFYRYDPATNRWTTLPRPSRADIRWGYGGVIDGKFYAVDSGIVEVYDPATNRWTAKASPLSLPVDAAATVMLARIYIVGGRGLDEAENWIAQRTTLMYDPATDTWTSRADMPTGRYGISASRIFVNGLPRLEVVGGSRPGNNLQYIP